MSSLYPGGIDSLPTNQTNGTVSEDTHPRDHANLAAAVNAIERCLGVDPQASYETVADAILAALAGGGSQPIQILTGSPLGAVVPTGIGYLGVDTTNGLLWLATGVANTDWVQIGGNSLVNDTGVTSIPGVVAALSGGPTGGQVSALANGNSGITATAGHSASMSGAGGTTVQVTDDGGGNSELGFFGVTPVVKPATPVTLADVIAALQALGLVT